VVPTDGHAVPLAEVDLRVGGSYRIDLRGPSAVSSERSRAATSALASIAASAEANRRRQVVQAVASASRGGSEQRKIRATTPPNCSQKLPVLYACWCRSQISRTETAISG
jgi:hypothetical protein